MSHTMFIILSMGLTVFAIRSIAFVFANYISLPKAVKESLELLPPAILIVVIASGIVVSKKTGALDISVFNPYLIATIATFIIATRIKNFFAVIFSGYLVFLAVSRFIPS